MDVVVWVTSLEVLKHCERGTICGQYGCDTSGRCQRMQGTNKYKNDFRCRAFKGVGISRMLFLFQTCLRSAWPCLMIALAALLLKPHWVSAQDSESKNYALVIGIDKYPASIAGIPPLKYAVKDAQALKEVLSKKDYEVVSLIGQDAKRQNIIIELTRLARIIRPQDSVLIYFAGHGVRCKLGERSHSFWLTHYASLPQLETEGIRLLHVLDYINDIPAKRKILILDHCHSGNVEFQQALVGKVRAASDATTIQRDLFPKTEFENAVKNRGAEGLVVLAAARDAAHEIPGLEHGILTYLLLEALNTNKADTHAPADGKLSVDELKDYLDKNISSLATKYGVTQEWVGIFRGVNLNWNLADVADDPDELLRLVGQLEAKGKLDPRIALICTQAIKNWELNIASEKDMKIVSKLKSLRDFGTDLTWDAKSSSLESFVRVL